MYLYKTRTRDTAVWLAHSACMTVLLPFKAMAFVGNKITDWPYEKIDGVRIGRFCIGDVFKTHANKILVPLSYCGDGGYLGYALEQGGKSFQFSPQVLGALGTFPATTVLLLIGDDNPPLLILANKLPSSIIGNVFKSAADLIVRNKKCLVPLAWMALSINGLSLVVAAATKHVDIGQIAHTATPYLPQAVDVLLRLPEFSQGAAIFAGTTALAYNQYLQLSKAKDADGLAEICGKFATGNLSFCTAMTVVTAVVDKSPSLMLSAGAFMVLNYCQYRLSKLNALKL